MILITGASGKTGKSILQTLAQMEPVCTLIHRAEQSENMKTLGATKVIIGDVQDPATLKQALQGVNKIYHICPNMHPNETEIGKQLIKLAKAQNIQHFVYHSVLHPHIQVMNHHWQKMRVEELLFASGLPFTILQPAPYMQNLLAGWKNMLETGILKIPYSVEKPFSFVDLTDVAEAAKIVLSEPNHLNAIYELVGTQPLTYSQVADLFSQVVGRDIKAEQEEINQWRTNAAGLNEYARENLINMFNYYDQFGFSGNPQVLTWLLKREPTSLSQFIQKQYAGH